MLTSISMCDNIRLTKERIDKMKEKIKEIEIKTNNMKYTPTTLKDEELRDTIGMLYNIKNNIDFLIKVSEEKLEQEKEKK